MLDVFTHSQKFIFAKNTREAIYAKINSLYFSTFSTRERLSFESYDPVQSILRRIKKSSQVRRNRKTLIYVLRNFWALLQKFISTGETGHKTWFAWFRHSWETSDIRFLKLDIKFRLTFWWMETVLKQAIAYTKGCPCYF